MPEWVFDLFPNVVVFNVLSAPFLLGLVRLACFAEPIGFSRGYLTRGLGVKVSVEVGHSCFLFSGDDRVFILIERVAVLDLVNIAGGLQAGLLIAGGEILDGDSIADALSCLQGGCPFSLCLKGGEGLIGVLGILQDLRSEGLV